MKILIVEDEQRIAKNLKKGLELQKHVVDLAFDGQDGFDMAENGNYDMIILDLMLPIMDGMEVCKKLRMAKIFTPILMLTAKSAVEDKVNGLDIGADDYLTKPFSFEELVARVRALKRRKNSQEVEPNILSSQSLTLDTLNFDVMRDGKKITLTKKEFGLLEYLLTHKGKILTKENIISKVWDFDADILPNTVEVYIRNLRNKIDLPFKQQKPLIQTVRGFGYKII